MDARTASEFAAPGALVDARRHLQAGLALAILAALVVASLTARIGTRFLPDLAAPVVCGLAVALFAVGLIAASLAQRRRRVAAPIATPIDTPGAKPGAKPASGHVPMRLLAAASLPLLAGAARLALGFAEAGSQGGAGSPLSETVATIWLAGLAAAGFVVLVGERALHATPEAKLPEAPGLTRLARLALLAILIAAIDVLTRIGAPGWVAKIPPVAAVFLALASAEGALRALAVLLLPLRAAGRASPLADSTLAGLVTRPPWTLPGAGRAALESHFGIDLSRSWALGFTRRAALPVGLALAVFAWLLTAVHVVPTDERAVAERFGVPTAVFQPGLHLTLPWPLGSVRPVELGTVHRIPIGSRAQVGGSGVGDNGAAESGLGGADSRQLSGLEEEDEAGLEAIRMSAGRREMSLSEAGSAARDEASGDAGRASAPSEPGGLPGDPPTSEDRLWDTRHSGDMGFLIASAEGGRQSFAVLQADVSVLYRVGLDDASALRAAYAVEAPEALVRSVAGALVERRLARLSLADALGGDRARIEHELLETIRGALGDLGAGIEAMAVVVEAMHPPPDAATAYHRVQAAEILASVSVATARSRALAAMQAAQSAAATEQAAAVGTAADTVAAARIDALGFAADDAAWRAGPDAFRLERYLARLTKGLANADLLLLDSRLDGKSVPLVDLREPSGVLRDITPELEPEPEAEDPRSPVH